MFKFKIISLCLQYAFVAYSQHKNYEFNESKLIQSLKDERLISEFQSPHSILGSKNSPVPVEGTEKGYLQLVAIYKNLTNMNVYKKQYIM